MDHFSQARFNERWRGVVDAAFARRPALTAAYAPPVREIFRQLNYLLSAREKRNGGLLFLLMLGGAFSEVVGVGAIPAFLAVIVIPEKILEYGPARAVYDTLGIGSSREMILWAAVGLIIVFVVKNLYLTFLAYAKARYSSNRQVGVSNRLFRAYLSSPYTFHLQRNTAELLRNTNSEASAISSVVLTLFIFGMEGMVLGLIFTGLLVALGPVLTLVTFATFGVLTYLFWRGTRTKVKEFAKEEQRHRKQSVMAVNQGLGGFKDARVLGREDYFLQSYRESTVFKAKAAQYKAFIQATPRLFLETIAISALLGVTAFYVIQGQDIELVVPTLTLLAVAVIRLMPSFTKIAGAVNSLQWQKRAMNAVYGDLIELDAVKPIGRGGAPVPFERELRLERVSYQYPNQEGTALDDVTLTVPKNSSVGFVGPSGAGKTTVVDVVLGLLDPTAGRVTVDGADMREHMAGWQRKIGYIPQQIFLTDDTVRRNVAFGRDDAEIDDAQVWRALEAAQLRETVEALPEGLDTHVGERGVRLSGGQRQRIGIARALYHEPEVLVMDEATSALDNQTERQFVEALEGLQGEHTMIVIAHRLSTVRGCDTLFMLDQGRLVAEGSYDDLMLTSEVFRRMAGEPAIAVPVAG
ncbi:ABC transporter ATP-binding protein [Rubrivirga sp. S365]|uniref:ABC transporter ATP-binding protein n=1 Tax=Rubrivirga litoralis TaxID=3075598 RepID=A0ABU3BSD5_9BACT|nr:MULTISPECIES: ABC transporter ATP-binding protein [unclassified Rubrivirga]MDT0632204.1 ABC transporter ATP-binding protein [Rubrivirga sp. F394]MDT7856814.1 ABC transporter ATP-binding protein [Rubrivirga sp. S365]